jgi:hypothetical protein
MAGVEAERMEVDNEPEKTADSDANQRKQATAESSKKGTYELPWYVSTFYIVFCAATHVSYVNICDFVSL